LVVDAHAESKSERISALISWSTAINTRHPSI